MTRWSRCPRCKGDVRLDRDEYGWYEECLMCGYTHDLAITEPVRVPALERDTEKIRVRRAA